MVGTARGSATRWGIVLGVAFAVALVLAMLILRQSRTSLATSSLPTGLAVGPTARQVYPPALETARTWQPDAQPAVFSAHWTSHHSAWPSRVTWVLQFYSPSAHQLATIAVEGERARMLRESPVPYALPAITDGNWQVDSPQALETWWNAGGATFLSSHSEVEVAATLRVEEGQVVWIITGITGNQVWTVTVDGMTGAEVSN